MRTILLTLLLVITALYSAGAQAVPDTTYKPPITNPTYEYGTGPLVMIDEAHYNYHTAGGRYLPFAELLRRDGYRVEPFTEQFTEESLAECDILVIANALDVSSVDDWSAPSPGAFTILEAGRVQQWVKAGGSLLLIFDHMPFPGAALEMAKAFKLRTRNSFVMDTLNAGPSVFRRSDGTLLDHPITNGRDSTERIDSVASFTGTAYFAKTDYFQPLMVMDSQFVHFMPREAWEFDANTPTAPARGWYQGGVLELQEGRVAVFGEAAMFTAQVAPEENRKAGMNCPIAGQNAQFLLNVMRWLSRKI